MDAEELKQVGDHYNEASFWRKARRIASRVSQTFLHKGLTLYCCLQDDDPPRWAKGIIIGALGYFVLPADAVPDMIPAVGFSDDLGALGVALAAVAAHVKPEHEQKAQSILNAWFGDRPPRLDPPADQPAD